LEGKIAGLLLSSGPTPPAENEWLTVMIPLKFELVNWANVRLPLPKLLVMGRKVYAAIDAVVNPKNTTAVAKASRRDHLVVFSEAMHSILVVVLKNMRAPFLGIQDW
jgi:hypothetical protein